jgi:hypothetical protein
MSEWNRSKLELPDWKAAAQARPVRLQYIERDGQSTNI